MKIYICPNDQYKVNIGIHLNNPDGSYLDDAIERAQRDLFPAIYCHYDVRGTTQYIINSDVLNRLIGLTEYRNESGKQEFHVFFLHAAQVTKKDTHDEIK